MIFQGDVYLDPGDKPKVKWYAPKLANNYLISLVGHRITVTIEPFAERATQEHYAYYWSRILPQIADALGYEKHEVKEVHKALKEKLGEESISGKSKVFLAEWTARVIRYAAIELDIVVEE
jgi:hypothetical protein